MSARHYESRNTKTRSQHAKWLCTVVIGDMGKPRKKPKCGAADQNIERTHRTER